MANNIGEMIHFASQVAAILPEAEQLAHDIGPDAQSIFAHGQKIAELFKQIEDEAAEIQRLAGKDLPAIEEMFKSVTK